jgi:FKBP-type peptidyl-prolyl cis-trans isomerase FkpA
MNRVRIILFLSLLVLAQSCSNKHKQSPPPVNIESKEFKDKLVDVNKGYVKRESDEIDQYVAHKGWKMITTGTGLRYMITHKGTGPLALPDKKVKVNYNVRLMDGTLCYSSDKTGAREFIVGMDNIESGLHEGIQYMHVGDKAIMILPSHLAYGLVGDGNKIPGKASVLYELELLSSN